MLSAALTLTLIPSPNPNPNPNSPLPCSPPHPKHDSKPVAAYPPKRAAVDVGRLYSPSTHAHAARSTPPLAHSVVLDMGASPPRAVLALELEEG